MLEVLVDDKGKGIYIASLKEKSAPPTKLKRIVIGASTALIGLITEKDEEPALIGDELLF